MAIDIIRTGLRLPAAFARRNHRDGAHLPHSMPKLLRVTRHIGQCPGWRLRQASQQPQRRGKFVRLTCHQDKVEEAASRIANTDDLAAKPTPRAAQRLRIAAGIAIESQTQLVGLLARAPAAF